jgi:hypothetical protein
VKKDLFWKIIALLIIVWLFLWLRSTLYFYFSSGLIKINKITEQVYVWEHDPGHWIKLKQEIRTTEVDKKEKDDFSWLDKYSPKKK